MYVGLTQLLSPKPSRLRAASERTPLLLRFSKSIAVTMGGMKIDTPASESAGDSESQCDHLPGVLSPHSCFGVSSGMEFHSERVTVSQAFRSAFVASMDGVDLFDAKLWAYTKRRSDDAGIVSLSQPRATPASAACLRDTSDHFEKGEYRRLTCGPCVASGLTW